MMAGIVAGIMEEIMANNLYGHKKYKHGETKSYFDDTE
jgi:hypothetical protein